MFQSFETDNFAKVNQHNNIRYKKQDLEHMFITALNFNNDTIIDSLIQSGVNINGDNNNYYNSYLHRALLSKNYYIALILVSRGAKVNYKFDKFEKSLIHDIMYIPPCLCVGKCPCKRLTYERINLIKAVISKGCQMVFPNSKNTPYKYAIDNYFPDELSNFIYNASKKQGSTEKPLKSKNDDDFTNNSYLFNSRNNFQDLTGYNDYNEDDNLDEMFLNIRDKTYMDTNKFLINPDRPIGILTHY